MSTIAIRVEHLSKRYELGALQQQHDTLRDGIAALGSRIAGLARRGRRTHPDPQSAIRNPQSSAAL